MIIDDKIAAIGSCNLDGLSIHQNQEIMLVTTNQESVDNLNAHFEQDKLNSRLFTYQDWQNRPLHQKISGYLLKPFKRYL